MPEHSHEYIVANGRSGLDLLSNGRIESSQAITTLTKVVVMAIRGLHAS